MAITNATRVADFGSGIGTEGAVLQVDNTNNRLGVGTTNPQAMLQVGTGVSVYGNSGIVSATSFYGDGANLTNVGMDTGVVVADQILVLGVTTVGSAVTINSTGIDAVSGVITASSFVGGGANITALSGTNIASGTVAAARVATLNQNTSGTAGGLTGTPDITVRNITGVAATFTGVLTYEDVTNVDSVGIVTARGGFEIGAAGVGGTITPQGNAIFVGVTTVGTGLTLADNVRAKFGNSGDLAVYHNGSHGYVENQVDGQDLYLTSTKDIYLKTGDGATGTHTVLYAADNAGIELRYDNVKKFETTIEGTITTGIATVTAIDGGISAWVLGANGTNHYTFTGPGNLSATDDPQIELQRGQTYVFRNRSGGHPFRIQSTVNGSTGTQYSTGVTNNDGGDGTDITFDVPFDAPNILYYQCTSHANMGGVMLIGERAIPARDETSQATLVANDAGKVISTTTGGWVVPTGVLAAGDAVTLINKSGSGQTITCSAVTMYDSGDGSTVTSKTLGARGVCTIWFESDSVAYISGAGLS